MILRKINKILKSKVENVILIWLVTPGHKKLDHLRIMALCNQQLFFFDYLNEGGNFVAKVLAGGRNGYKTY